MRSQYFSGPEIFNTQPCYSEVTPLLFQQTWNSKYDEKREKRSEAYNIRNNLHFNTSWGRSRYAYPANPDELINQYNEAPKYRFAARFPTDYLYEPNRDKLPYYPVSYYGSCSK